MKYYKVVTANLKSAWLSHAYYTEDLAVQYKLNEWVYPIKDTQLMVFSDFDFAYRWSNIIHDVCYIFECEVKLSKDHYFVNTDRLCIRDFLLSKDKREYWLDNNQDEPPLNTVFCDAVKLITKVAINDY